MDVDAVVSQGHRRNCTGCTILVKIRPSQWDGGTDSHLGFTSQISPYLSAQQMCMANIHLAYIPDFISGLLWFGHMCWGDMVLPVVVEEEVLALHEMVVWFTWRALLPALIV
jgi:hypothetical protein